MGDDPGTWGAFLTPLLIGIAAIVGAVARPLFGSLKGRNYCLVTPAALIQLDDLHDWHGPDSKGEQGWRGNAIERKLDALRAEQAETHKLLRELIQVTRNGRK